MGRCSSNRPLWAVPHPSHSDKKFLSEKFTLPDERAPRVERKNGPRISAKNEVVICGGWPDPYQGILDYLNRCGEIVGKLRLSDERNLRT
jgi:hypothetical protein